MKLDEKFWLKVDKSGDCWIWTGARSGSMKVKYGWVTRQSRQMAAHRWSWILHYGAIPNGFHILHRCDNPPCVNPRHLFLGTAKDNMQDCAKKGRLNSARQCGEDNPMAHLCTRDVSKIRALYEDGISQRLIARKFGISQSNVSLIVRRFSWGHIS